MTPLVWAILLLVGGIALIFLEIFIPSGGVLSFLAALCLVASIVVAFTDGINTGLVMLLVAAIVVPVVVAGAIRWWPNTSMGRVIMLMPPEREEDVLPDTPDFRDLKTLIGRRGIARGKMLPSGPVQIDDRRYDALADGVAIDAGQPIRVVAVNMNRLLVRIDDTIPTAEELPDNVLDRPADSLGLDSLDEPLV